MAPSPEQAGAPKEKARFDPTAITPGVTVRVSQKIVEGNKERIQVFEGIVLAKRGSRGMNQTITVRKMSGGYGVERIFPLALPTITSIEVVRRAKVRRAKLNYLRNPRARKLKEVSIENRQPSAWVRTEATEERSVASTTGSGGSTHA